MQKEWIWPASIIAFFVAFISFMMFVWAYANSQHIDLVVPNYYERQIKYQQQIDRIQRTKGLPEPLRLNYSSRQRLLEIYFPAFFQPEKVKGNIILYRPSDAKMDYSIAIALNSEGKQFIPTENLLAGLWRIKIDWEADGLDYYYEEAVTF